VQFRLVDYPMCRSLRLLALQAEKLGNIQKSSFEHSAEQMKQILLKRTNRNLPRIVLRSDPLLKKQSLRKPPNLKLLQKQASIMFSETGYEQQFLMRCTAMITLM